MNRETLSDELDQLVKAAFGRKEQSRAVARYRRFFGIDVPGGRAARWRKFFGVDAHYDRARRFRQFWGLE